MNEFLALGLCAELSDAFGKLGFKSPLKVQALAIPRILQKKDIFVQSETGTGKTFAYLAPAISESKGLDASKGPLILVLCPTQELAVQVAKQAIALLEASGIPMTVLSLLGGSPLSRQEAALKKKPHIVVGTPGRTADLIRMRFLKLASLGFLVLDEADRLFSQEYRESVAGIAEAVPPACCKILASATIPQATRKQAKAFLKSPESLDLLEEGVLSRDIEHWIFYVEQRKRIVFLRKLEAVLHPAKCLIFASTGETVVKTAEYLAGIGLPADSILSKQEKEHRRVAIERFENGSLRYLVTTDLGARGLDIAGITHIISLDFPEESSGYVHRAGRTARAGGKGVSIVLGDGWDIRKASKIAVDRRFVFRTKVLEAGAILEPPVEEFFAIVEAGEEEKREYRANRRGGQEKPRSDE